MSAVGQINRPSRVRIVSVTEYPHIEIAPLTRQMVFAGALLAFASRCARTRIAMRSSRSLSDLATSARCGRNPDQSSQPRARYELDAADQLSFW